MKITINKRGIYYCYVGEFSNEESWNYKCVETGGGLFGLKIGYSANEGEVLDRDGNVVAKILFHSRVFKPHVLTITLLNDGTETVINANFVKRKLHYLPFSFEWNGKSYRFESFQGNYKILYENNRQVASFDKQKIYFFKRETFVTLAENHLSAPLIISLSIFNDIWTRDQEDATITFDLGDLAGKAPPDGKRWKPKK